MKLILWRSPTWCLTQLRRWLSSTHCVSLRGSRRSLWCCLRYPEIAWECDVSLLKKALGPMRELCKSVKLYKQPSKSHIVETSRTMNFSTNKLKNLGWHCLCGKSHDILLYYVSCVAINPYGFNGKKKENGLQSETVNAKFLGPIYS